MLLEATHCLRPAVLLCIIRTLIQRLMNAADLCLRVLTRLPHKITPPFQASSIQSHCHRYNASFIVHRHIRIEIVFLRGG